MFKGYGLGCIFAFSLMGTVGYAADVQLDQTGPYVGLSGGYAFSSDQNTIGLGADLGYMFQQYVGIEGGINSIVPITSIFVSEGAESGYVAAKLTTNNVSNFNFFGKLGVALVKDSIQSVLGDSDSDLTTKAFLGLGADYGFTQHFKMGVGVNYFYSGVSDNSYNGDSDNGDSNKAPSFKALDFGMAYLDVSYHF